MIQEIYDFKTEIARQKLEHYEDGEKEWSLNILTIDNLNELYEIDFDKRTCRSYDVKSKNTMVGFYLKVTDLEIEILHSR